MSSRNDHLALPQWSLGQVLLPDHFQAQERAILAQVATHQRFGQAPRHGVARLGLDEGLLAAGTLAIESATIMFQNGRLVDVPGNCTATNFQLSAVQDNQIEIFLHVFSRASDKKLVRQGPQSASSQVSNSRVAREVLRAEMWTTPRCEDAIETLKLAELSRDRSGQWQLGNYCPPLVALGTTPYLRSAWRSIVHLLDLAENRASTALVDSTLCGEEVWAARTVLAGTCEVRSILAEIEDGVAHHPHLLFEALRRLVLHVHTWLGSDLRNVAYPYLHTRFGATLRALLEPAEAALLRTAPLPRKILHFVAHDRTFIADPMPEGVRRAKNVYLACERQDGQSIAIGRLKLAAPSRLALLHEYALPGIGLQACPAPDIVLPSRGNLDFFLLAADEEWALAVQEGALAFLRTGVPDSFKATLCWGLEG
jgi:type VI secretion system protein ImpJ